MKQMLLVAAIEEEKAGPRELYKKNGLPNDPPVK